MQNKLLEVQKLNFSYNKKLILKNINFFINYGQIIGLLGANGTGKTTILKLLIGFLKIQQGNIFFNNSQVGYPYKYTNVKIRSQTGVVFQECSLDNKITVIENLMLSGKIYGFQGKYLQNLVNKIINIFDLNSMIYIKPENLSGGIKRRLELARAMLHQPQLLLLDEPTINLDENWRNLFFQQLKILSKLNKSMLISTHRLDEAEYCNRLLIMYNGNILLNCTPNELRSTVNKDKLILTINSNITKKEINGQVIKLNNHFPYLNFIQNNNKITVLLKKAYFIIQKIIYFLPSNFIISIYISKPTLNDAYLKITGSCLNKNLKTNNN